MEIAAAKESPVTRALLPARQSQPMTEAADPSALAGSKLMAAPGVVGRAQNVSTARPGTYEGPSLKTLLAAGTDGSLLT